MFHFNWYLLVFLYLMLNHMIVASDTRCFYTYPPLHLFCVLEDIGGVRIPFLCTLYSNAIILNSAQILGSSSISFRTLSCSYHNIFCSIGSSDLFDCLI